MKMKMTRGVVALAAIIMVTVTIPAVMGQIWDPSGVTADPGGPYSGTAGIPVQFDGTGSMGFISSYEWDFGYENITSTTDPIINHTYTSVGVYIVTLNVTDDCNDFNTNTTTANITEMEITQPPANQPPIADAGADQTVDEGASMSFSGSFTDPCAEDTHTIEWNFGDGEMATGTLTPSHAYADNGFYTVTLTVTDDDGGVGTDTLTVTVTNVAPTIDRDSFAGPMDPVQVGTGISTDAAFTDPGILDTHTAEWDWGDETTSEGTVDETDGFGTVSGSHAYVQAGVYTITLTVTDDDGGSDSMQYPHYVVVYDPDGGFVTGGGWITSPEGAYAPDPTLTGKATFGFVSKYKKGATVPTGQTEFQFHAGDLNFHSTSYDWLVIAGAKAQYKGTGTINGAGNYGFMLTAIDEKLTPSTDVDMFRIKIWDNDVNDGVVYDNQMHALDDADPATALGGGSIVIHKSK